MPDMNDLLRSGGDEAVRAHLARTERFVPERSSKANEARPNGSAQGGAERSTLRLIDPASWAGLPVPPRNWIVDEMVPADTVTLLTGEGSVGKSILALQLAAARSLGRAWLTTLPKPGRTLVLSAEDNKDEMHRRLDSIRAHLGAEWGDLTDIRILDLVGEDAVLGAVDKSGLVKPTPLFDLLNREIDGFRPDLCILDALSDVFAGDEIRRAQARQFIGLLKRPARDHGCAFLALAHPSLTGLSQGTGASGSTGWGNSVRSRMFFEKAKASDGSEPDPALRTLRVNKSNYGPANITLTLTWANGVYIPQTGLNSLDKRAQQNRADETFFELLALFNKQGQDVSHKIGPTFAPNRFAEHPQANGIDKKHFQAAMQRLITSKKITIDISGPQSRRRSRLVVVEGE